MTAFAAIDPLLNAWAREKGVHVYTHYRDTDVRIIEIYGPDDDQGHLRLSDIDEHGIVGVHAAASDGFSADRQASLPELARVLSDVYDELAQHVSSWEGRNPYVTR